MAQGVNGPVFGTPDHRCKWGNFRGFLGIKSGHFTGGRKFDRISVIVLNIRAVSALSFFSLYSIFSVPARERHTLSYVSKSITYSYMLERELINIHPTHPFLILTYFLVFTQTLSLALPSTSKPASFLALATFHLLVESFSSNSNPACRNNS